MSQQAKVRGTATSIRTVGNSTIVRYHNTDVVIFNSEDITLDCGGWKTATTKTRMNQAANQFDLGYHVFSLRGLWMVDYRGEKIAFDGQKVTLKR